MVTLKIRITGFQIRKIRKKKRKKHVTYQIKALGKPFNMVTLEIRISGGLVRKIGNIQKKGDLSNESS